MRHDMSLSAKQQRFTECVGLLIAQAYRLGYGFTFGDAYRDSRVHGAHGIKGSYSAAKSVHKQRLAVDLNLFVEGEYIHSGDHIAYQRLGEFWEGLDPDARWGGNFQSNDANHFSFEHEGYK
jgi:hypothetical protein